MKMYSSVNEQNYFVLTRYVDFDYILPCYILRQKVVAF